MKKLLLSLCLLISSIGVFAQHRSEQEAMQIAQEFFTPRPAAHKARLVAVPQSQVRAKLTQHTAKAKKAPAQNSACYIVNDEANNRFVIVSADEQLNKILGYSNKGLFDTNNVPDGLLFLINGYSLQYDSLLAGKVTYIPSQSLRAESIIAVDPILSTEWGQGYPFSELCPEDPLYGGKCVTGCVATAMAQVMKHYNYPEKGTGYLIYESAPYGIKQSLDFSSIQFDWNNMPDKYDGNWTDEQIDAVARLNHACGISVAMQYTNSLSGSGAYPADIAYALINHFGYNPNLKYYDADYYYKSEWDSLIQDNLSKKRPVLYGGDGGEQNGGHQFVIDGVNADGLYHVNWGWNGDYNDGYYELTALKPGDYDFSLGQSMVCGITPDQEEVEATAAFSTIAFIPNEWISPVNVGTYTSCKLGKTQLCGTSFHTIKHKFNGYIGIGVFDKDFNFVKSLTQSKANTDGAHYYSEISLYYKYDSQTFTEGSQYYIAPYSIESDATKPIMMHTKGGLTDWFLATVEEGKMKLKPKDIIVPDGLVGTFDVKALDKAGNIKTWKTTVAKADDENGKYYFQNFDPAAGEITVTAYMQKNGNYEIPLDKQTIEGISLYSASSSIIVNTDKTSNTMSIDDVWGTKQRSVTGDKASDSELSYYKRADYSYPPDPIIVENPVVVVDDNHVLTISCATEDALIYYTKSEKGSEPNELSLRYMAPVELTENTVITAKAFKNGIWSESVECSYTGFTVSSPEFYSSDNIVFISCPNPKDAVIYYTTDDDIDPNELYNKEKGVPCEKTTTIKAIATYPNWNPSPIVSYIHVIEPKHEIVINDNVAGQLPSNISNSQKLNTTSLKISGKLNGTDIKFIREMLSEGSLAYLDIEQTYIVEGGDSYNPELYNDMTEDNVVGSRMFYNCKNLISLKLPASAIKIDVVAIHGCENIKELALPESCETVITGAIQSCKSLESVYLSKSVRDFTGNIFDSCPNLKVIDVDAENPYFTSVEGIVFSKDMSKLVKYPVGNCNITYTVPTTVQIIGEHAFKYSVLKDVVLPTALTSIENFSFLGCTQLEEIVIPSSVTHLGFGAFQLCQDLSNIILSPNIEKIEGGTFNSCISLSEITIGKGTLDVKGSAFDYCSSLRAINVDEDNEMYSSVDGTLYSKDTKTLVRCPAGLYKDDFLVPDGIEVIAENAFKECEKIDNFTLPSSLVEISSFAFTNCAMTSLVIPSNVTKIGAGAFQLCKELETLVLPKGIKEISMGIASNCSKLSYLYIPGSVESIGSSAFSWCKKLSVIKCDIKNVSNLEVGLFAFNNIPDDCTWDLPYGTPGKYKAQPWWIETWKIKPIPGDVNGDDSVDVADISAIISVMAGDDALPDLVFRADVNGDGAVNVADISSVIDIMAAMARASKVPTEE